MSNETTPTLVGDHQNGITDFTAIIVEVKPDDKVKQNDIPKD